MLKYTTTLLSGLLLTFMKILNKWLYSTNALISLNVECIDNNLKRGNKKMVCTILNNSGLM